MLICPSVRPSLPFGWQGLCCCSAYLAFSFLPSSLPSVLYIWQPNIHFDSAKCVRVWAGINMQCSRWRKWFDSMESGSIHLWWWQNDIVDRGMLKCHLLSHRLQSWRENEGEPQRAQHSSVLLQESVGTRCGGVNQTRALFPSCHRCEYVPFPHQSIVSLSSAALKPSRCFIVIWSHMLWSWHGLSDCRHGPELSER